MASPGKRNQGCTWTAFCSLFCMPELLPKVGVLLACFFDRYKNFKFINWYLDVTIEYKYNVQCFCLKRILNIIIQAGIFREYRNKCFWRPKCFGKAIPQIMTLQILSGKGAVQIMPLRKLGGKFHFFLRFCTRKRSETYIYVSLRLRVQNWTTKWHFPLNFQTVAYPGLLLKGPSFRVTEWSFLNYLIMQLASTLYYHVISCIIMSK